jgi:hypothetical protein
MKTSLEAAREGAITQAPEAPDLAGIVEEIGASYPLVAHVRPEPGEEAPRRDREVVATLEASESRAWERESPLDPLIMRGLVRL